MGLVSPRMATAAIQASASLFMLGGVPGTFHHLYFSGTTTPVMAVGASFSALEVVPLVVLGHEAWEHWRLQHRAPWMERLKWPLTFFVAVAFWNMLGAGCSASQINPPIALYYIQGLNTTPVHAHAALFGCTASWRWASRCWCCAISGPNWFQQTPDGHRVLGAQRRIGADDCHQPAAHRPLPVPGQREQGLWYARSEAFMQQPFMQTLRWVRTFRDVVFIVGALSVAWQVVRASWARARPVPRATRTLVPHWPGAALTAAAQVCAAHPFFLPESHHEHRQIQSTSMSASWAALPLHNPGARGGSAQRHRIARLVVTMSSPSNCTWRWRPGAVPGPAARQQCRTIAWANSTTATWANAQAYEAFARRWNRPEACAATGLPRRCQPGVAHGARTHAARKTNDFYPRIEGAVKPRQPGFPAFPGPPRHLCRGGLVLFSIKLPMVSWMAIVNAICSVLLHSRWRGHGYPGSAQRARSSKAQRRARPFDVCKIRSVIERAGLPPANLRRRSRPAGRAGGQVLIHRFHGEAPGIEQIRTWSSRP